MTHPHPHDSKLIWELAENEDNRNRARVFERDWHESYRMAGYRPAIEDYLPEESLERQGALLALARVDMACRFDTEDTPRVEDYLHLLEYEELTPEFVAGLAFEEYILRLENDEKPKLSEYRKRFPGAVRIIQELFLIQEAVAGEEFDQEEEAQKQQYDGYPEAGQSIEGFQLVHEIGSGSYAKVYLAQDSTLAGREVALKVTRGHHSEWLTLAKLQHTYIVPIYSYKQTIYEENRFDMVCMPYFGRVTLNILIDHENWGQCIDGSDIQKLVDSLQPESLLDETRDSSSRSRLAEMTFAQAVAWWGTCLADAMRHAHERRILHRDIKPTNILITPDCEPMLLDFNLAKETLISLASDETSQTEESPAEDSIGGTLAYMAPEHLEAMISGQTRLVDQRADIYSLGAVLYEALTRSDVMKKTHAPAKNKAEMLRQTLELRKLPPMSVRDLAPDVPLVLDRVIRKCLDPDPARRYLTAAQLGEDLKAVALDQPVRHAQEPISNRLRRNLKRNRKVLVSIVLMSVIMFFGPGLSLYRKLEQQRIAELSREAREDLQSSRTARLAGDFLNAQNLQHRVMRTLSDTPSLAPIYHQATQELELTKVMEQSRALAQKFFDDSGLLRYSTIHSTRLGGELDPDGIGLAISRVVKPILQLLDRMDTRSNSTLSDASPSFLTFLEPGQINEIRHWVELLMFEGVCAQFKANQDDTLRSGLKLSMSLASRFEPGLPWTILNERLSAALERRPVNELNWPEPDQESSAIACLEFADLAMLDGLTDRAMQWVRRAIALRPADPWIHHELALILERRGEYAAAIDRLEIAKSLNQQNVWASLELARLARVQGQYAQAFEEIHFIRQLSHNLETNHDLNAFIDLEQGLVEQGLGNFETSESLLHSIVYDKNTSSSIKLLGAQSLSEILLSKGRWTDLQYLLDEFETEDDGQTSWALIRSRLLLGQNRHEEALLCLDRYLISNPEVIKAREMRAQILLKSGKVQQALEESQEIVRRSDTPLHRRQLERCRIAVLAELSP
ncbi:MAG: hypothetical protein RJA81_691, partial [Planctomycetota bacterium]